MGSLVFLRLRAHRLLLTAALLSVTLTTCAVAVLVAFGSAVGDAGLRRALEDPTSGRALFEVSVRAGDEADPETDARVRRTVVRAYDGLPVDVSSSLRSASYGLPPSLSPSGTARPDHPDLTLLATLDRERVTVVRGSLPGAPEDGRPVPVALPETAAATLGLRPGDEVALSGRLDGGSLRVRLTGTYRPRDAASSYWRLDPLGGRGVRTLSFTSYGPMLTDPAAFASGRVPAAETVWQGRARFGTVTEDRADGLRRAVERAVAQLEEADRAHKVSAASGLPALLDELQRSLLVTRSSLLVSGVQLALLASLALLVVSGLLAADRAAETVWLRARGASRSAVAGLAAAEAALLAAPAAVAAPLVTGRLVRRLAGQGELARAGVRLDVHMPTVWSAAALTALVCAAALTAPALRRTAASEGRGAVPGRQRSLPAAVQAGADVALVALAGLACWQLLGRTAEPGAPARDTGTALGVDPVLVVAPALCLLAGAVLLLRLVPPAVRLAERRAARTRGLPLALVGWQLARRTARATAPVLLLVVAVSTGVFALGEHASWNRSQREQADFAAGADVRVDDMDVPALGQGGLFDRLDGVSAVMPAHRADASLPGDKEATVLAVDAPAAARVMRLRGDLADEPLEDTLTNLRPAGTRSRGKAGFALPGDAARLRLTVRLEALDSRGRAGTGAVTDRLSVTLTDRYGVPHDLPLGNVRADGEDHVLEADLAAGTGPARAAGPAAPLRLTGVRADYPVPRRAERHRLSLTRVAATVESGGVVRVPVTAGADGWTARTSTDAADPPGAPRPGGSPSRAQAPRSDADTPLSVRYDTGHEPARDDGTDGSRDAAVELRAAGPPADTVAALVTDAFLDAVDARVGDTVGVPLAGTQVRVRIAAAVRALPTTAAEAPGTDGGALVVDLSTLNGVLADARLAGLRPTEWWLAAEPGQAPRTAAALRARGDVPSVTVRAEERAALRDDPLVIGPLSVLPVAAGAAAALAVVGFAVASVAATRERARELAVLSALGASRRALLRVVAAEQGFLVLVAVAAGWALGALLTRAVVPLIVLTARAERPVPPVRVELPSALLIAAFALPLLAVALIVPRLTRTVRAPDRTGGE